jgi:hypothetical protein
MLDFPRIDAFIPLETDQLGTAPRAFFVMWGLKSMPCEMISSFSICSMRRLSVSEMIYINDLISGVTARFGRLRTVGTGSDTAHA